MQDWERPRARWGKTRGEEPILGEDWEEPGLGWDEPGEPDNSLTGVSRETLENQTAPPNADAAPLLGDAEILAAEALLDKRLLAVLLALGERPRQAGELARNLRVLARKRVRVKKKVQVRDRSGWGYREEVREVEEERWDPRPIPASTLYRLLARLRRAGLVEEYKGLDARRRYYRLTPLGRQVYDAARSHILRVLEENTRDGVVPWKEYEQAARDLGLPPGQLASQLGIRIAEQHGEKYALLPVRIQNNS